MAIGDSTMLNPFLTQSFSANGQLPPNYQEARDAFQRMQTQEMENYRNAPYDPNRVIPGIGVAAIGNSLEALLMQMRSISFITRIMEHRLLV